MTPPPRERIGQDRLEKLDKHASAAASEITAPLLNGICSNGTCGFLSILSTRKNQRGLEQSRPNNNRIALLKINFVRL